MSRDTREWPVFDDLLTGAQTNYVVIAAPGAGYRLVFKRLTVTTTAAAKLTLAQGSAGSGKTFFNIYAGDNGGMTEVYDDPLGFPENTALTLTTTTGNSAVCGLYDIEPI